MQIYFRKILLQLGSFYMHFMEIQLSFIILRKISENSVYFSQFQDTFTQKHRKIILLIFYNIFQRLSNRQVPISKVNVDSEGIISTEIPLGYEGYTRSYSNVRCIGLFNQSYEDCSISPWLLEKWCCYRKYVTTLREYRLISVRIQIFKSVRWLEICLQTVEFSFSLLKQNHGKKRVSRAY